MIKTRNLLSAFTILFSSLRGDFVDHLKPAKNKDPACCMPNIDYIYMINLDYRPEKFQLASQQLLKYGIHPYRFSAVQGWALSTKAIQEVSLVYQPGMTPLMATTYRDEANGRPSHEFMKEYGRTYLNHCLGKGALGCALSHISVLKDAYESQYETIWVLEDDIECVMDPNIIPELINKLDLLVGKNNWDVLFTDVDYRTGIKTYCKAAGAQKRPDMDCSANERTSEKYITNKVVDQNFKKVSARFGTHSMIIRRSGIKKLLEFSINNKIFLPYDLENYLIEDLKRYSFTFDVVTNMLNSLSDIGCPTVEKIKD